ncbi:hypothetical protein ACEQ8H_004567 [Pleosporales sp. CAS-2024a]
MDKLIAAIKAHMASQKQPDDTERSATDAAQHDSGEEEEEEKEEEADAQDEAIKHDSSTNPLPFMLQGTHAQEDAFQIAHEMLWHNLQRLSTQAQDAVLAAIAQLKHLGISGVAKMLASWMKAHPAETAAILVAIIFLAATPAVLAAMGFTSAGIAAGSAAAALQSGIGSVAAGSLFAICQSAMMGGYGIGIILAVPAIAGAVTWTTSTAWKWWKGKKSEDGEGGRGGGGDGGHGGDDDDDGNAHVPDPHAALVLPQPAPETPVTVGDVVADVAKVVKLGAIVAVGSAVYRFRRWQANRAYGR